MARMRTIAPVGTISGSLGALEFAQTRIGQVVKVRKRRSFKSSPLQKAVHARLSAATDKWHALTTEQRAAWSTLAALGAYNYGLALAQNLSGYQLFLRWYPNAFCFDFPLGSGWDPPTNNRTSTWPGLVSLTLNYTSSTFSIKTTGGGPSGNRNSEEIYIGRFCKSILRPPTKWSRLSRRPKNSGSMDYTTEFTTDPQRVLKDEIVWIRVRACFWGSWPSVAAYAWTAVKGSPP